jgi:hypothetical protein
MLYSSLCSAKIGPLWTDIDRSILDFNDYCNLSAAEIGALAIVDFRFQIEYLKPFSPIRKAETPSHYLKSPIRNPQSALSLVQILLQSLSNNLFVGKGEVF